ncbi:glucokinase [Inhella gelatinilytica]|uniref:Glucokinase n=1 Tax=Inhella gelatinilytica TaxID=2795030 RepID=A0A931ND16_9BURK|nr:glucokinase [Inhella gelatinilytica]MBH9551780.1 glucokinase [Inhella gelatinilytica]
MSPVFDSASIAPYPWLLADLGGSNARFAWVAGPGQELSAVRTLAVADHASLEDAIRAYLRGLGPVEAPRSAAIAVATAVTGDAVVFRNNPWSFSQQQLQAVLGLRQLCVLNDFEALALSLPRLRAAQWRPLGEGVPRFDVPVAVIGPGTGLGVAGLMPVPGGWLPVAGEGGHATLAPADDYESELLRVVRREFPHVSGERLLSGLGLPTLYAAVAAVEGQRAAVGVDAPWIVERGLGEGAEESDAVASRTLEVFCAMLGGFAGSVALSFGARGGVFIGGGIVPRLGARLDRSAFRARFEAKGRCQGYLAAIPTAVVTDGLAALDGAAQALSHVQN